MQRIAINYLPSRRLGNGFRSAQNQLSKHFLRYEAQQLVVIKPLGGGQNRYPTMKHGCII